MTHPKRKFLGETSVPQIVLTIIGLAVHGYLMFKTLWQAFDLRMLSVRDFGWVIHEFDPWFNFRAAKYMSDNGWDAFFTWFDYGSWYPLGRPVGTTTYPALQFTSVGIEKALAWIGGGWQLTLTEVCCMLPAWGGVTATLFLSLLTYEATHSLSAAVGAATLFSIVPGHLMRSMSGAFDNECIAMTAMLMTFYFWVRSLRTESSWWIGSIAGLAYGYMVAAWGGFTFVINMVALHAAICAVKDTISNRYSPGLYKAYSLFFVIGTLLATRVPPVGLSPFKSLEQLSALVTFIGLQVLATAAWKCNGLKVEIMSPKGRQILIRHVAIAFVLVVAVCVALFPTGWFGPLSSRVRGLFLKHTRTGNPLVDSVSEHSAAAPGAIWTYLHFSSYGWLVGFFLMAFIPGKGRGISFLYVYSVAAYYFCTRMSRLLLLAAPIGSAVTGVVIGAVVEWVIAQFVYAPEDDVVEDEEKFPKGQKPSATAGTNASITNWYKKHRRYRQAIALVLCATIVQQYNPMWRIFEDHAIAHAYAFANPRILYKARQPSGKDVIIGDYLESYQWLKENTPEDARVMAWWDYGYQISGIGNRTTIADGNTWNHEHIATLGKCLTSPVEEAHSLIRHLADYVLIWTGSRADDLAKSPHMARIGNSVYHDICPNDPSCSQFGFYAGRKPTPMMAKSLLYNLHSAGVAEGVSVDPALFQEVYKSWNKLVRIYKVMNVSEESKAWIADPANRKCKAPGHWECPGQYPPAPEIQQLIARRVDFAQLEDFNKKGK